jgi:hypothetical protein
MVEGLLVFARWNGYRRVRLEVATPELQEPAVRLYARLGFRSIERYRDGPCELSMERDLQGGLLPEARAWLKMCRLSSAGHGAGRWEGR